MVVYHRKVKCPKFNIFYDGMKIQQKKNFKYLGFHLDTKLSFRYLIDAQTTKMRKAYSILKFIHKQFPSFFTVKVEFFNTYIWSHLYMMATVYCLFSRTSRKRLSGFYRRCLRITYSLFQCSTDDLHQHFQIPTIDQKYKICLIKRMKNIQVYEPTFIDIMLQNKHLYNVLHDHYQIKACLHNMCAGRPNKRPALFLTKECSTFFDHLCNFVLG